MMIFILVVAGLACGSFVNALVWRLYQQSELTGKKKRQDLSIVNGRSMCPHCGHKLSGLDLVPVLSWLSLGGKCRYCKKPIGMQYPLVEVTTALLFAVSYVFWPNEFGTIGWVNFIGWLLIVVGFVALSVYDLRWMLLPNRVVYPLAGIAAALTILNIVSGNVSALEVVSSVAIAGGIFYALFVVSKGSWIGGGDVKLGLLIGLVLASPKHAFLMLLLASLLGTIVAVPGLLVKRLQKSSRIPFGPFLITATIVVYLFGTSIIAWYERVVLLQG